MQGQPTSKETCYVAVIHIMKIHRDLDLTPSNKELSDSGYIVKVGQTEFTDRRDVRNENQGCLQPFDMSN